MQPQVPSSARKPFYGWRVVAAAFVAQLVSTGLTFNAFGVFFVPLAEEFQTTRATIALGPGLLILVMGLLGPVLGRAVDAGHLRVLMLTGITLLCVGLLWISRTSTLWQAALIFGGLVATGSAMFGPLAAMALVSTWFVRRRGLALGVTVAGATVASLVAAPLAAALIDVFGWRDAVAILAIGAGALALPMFWAFVVARPEQIGQTPDGDPPRAHAESALPDPPETRALLRDPSLWLLSFGFAFLLSSPVIIGIHLVPFAEDLGMSRLQAATFFSATVPFSITGKLVFGALSDRVDLRLAAWVAMGLLAGVWGMLLTDPSYPALLATGALFGLGVGALGPLHGVVVGACFGRAAFGRVMGIGGMVGLPILAGAAPLVGLLFDLTGSYRLGFALQLGLLGVSALIFAFLRIPDVEPGTEIDATPEPVGAGAS